MVLYMTVAVPWKTLLHCDSNRVQLHQYTESGALIAVVLVEDRTRVLSGRTCKGFLYQAMCEKSGDRDAIVVVYSVS